MDLSALKEKIFGTKDESLKKQFSQNVLMDEFMDRLHDINFHSSKDIDPLIKLAGRIDDLSDWPDNPVKFWDLEAAFWDRRVDPVTKDMIIDELKKNLSGDILNIGSGSVNYMDSVNLDISFDMLDWNSSEDKVQADACFLPFKDSSFDSAFAVFVANYIKDAERFILEIKRVLKINSNVLFVQGKSIHPLHQLAENRLFSIDNFTGLLRRHGFAVRKIEKENLIFLRCRIIL